MISKKKSAPKNDPFYWNNNIVVFYEMKHGNDVIVNGTPLRFKYQRSTFKFIKMVQNFDTSVTWIDCMEDKTGVFRSFYVEQLRGVVRPKKIRKKNSV